MMASINKASQAQREGKGKLNPQKRTVDRVESPVKRQQREQEEQENKAVCPEEVSKEQVPATAEAIVAANISRIKRIGPIHFLLCELQLLDRAVSTDLDDLLLRHIAYHTQVCSAFELLSPDDFTRFAHRALALDLEIWSHKEHKDKVCEAADLLPVSALRLAFDDLTADRLDRFCDLSYTAYHKTGTKPASREDWFAQIYCERIFKEKIKANRTVRDYPSSASVAQLHLDNPSKSHATMAEPDQLNREDSLKFLAEACSYFKAVSESMPPEVLNAIDSSHRGQGAISPQVQYTRDWYNLHGLEYKVSLLEQKRKDGESFSVADVDEMESLDIFTKEQTVIKESELAINKADNSMAQSGSWKDVFITRLKSVHANITGLRQYHHSRIADRAEPIDSSQPLNINEKSYEEDKTASEKSVSKINMSVNATVTTPLPVLPADWLVEENFKILGSLSQATQRSLEPVGPHFLAHARRARHKRTFSEDDRIQAQNSVKKVEDDDAGDISEPEDPQMLLRDAKDWKSQDHYAVLGLSKYRYKATEEQIKRANRKKVLRHHPDKKAAAGKTEDDSFFKCLQKATEILQDPVKRRQFDSVDPLAEVEPPTKKQAQGANFYKLWSKVFKAEGRFSNKTPVPKFGDDKSSKEDVEAFYNFWYNFDSWRSFEYQDEDVPDDGESRDQKRHTERKNNNARKKKKTEDSARLRKLLDDVSAGDERIKKFLKEKNASKNAKKAEKEAAEKKAVEEAKAKKEAGEKASKEAEEKAKLERDGNKKAKEAAKNAVKKNKRVLKGSVKDANYFHASGDAPAAQVDAVLNDVELIQGKIDPDEIAELAGKLNGLKVADEIKSVWAGEAKRLVAAGKIKEGDVKTFA